MHLFYVIEKRSDISAPNDRMRQRFSVAVHPSSSVVLCSDGFMVTALEMWTDETCLSLMKKVVERSK